MNFPAGEEPRIIRGWLFGKVLEAQNERLAGVLREAELNTAGRMGDDYVPASLRSLHAEMGGFLA